MLLAVTALLTLALFPAGSPTVEDSPEDETVIVDREVVTDEDGDFDQLIRVGGDDDPLILGLGGRRGFIGVRLIEISEDLRKHYGASEDAGVLVSDVEADSPAAKAGIQVGDVITQVDGDRVDSTWDLSRAVRDKKSGDKVRLQVLRDRRAQDLTVTLEEREGRAGRDRIRRFRMPRGKAWTYHVDPERWKPMVLDNLDDLPKLEERLKDLEKRLKELEKRLAAR